MPKKNLPFTIIEVPEFIDLLILCNPNVEQILVKADALTQYLMKRFWEGRTTIKKMFASVDSKVSLTCDLWTSPNQKAILAATVHWTNSKVELHQLLLDAIELKGSHTGINIASSVYNILEDFGLNEKLFCITADNASNNLTMAQELEKRIEQFDSKQHLLGCTGHVFHLAAKAGLEALGHTIEEDIIDEFESQTNEVGAQDFDEDGWGSEKEKDEDKEDAEEEYEDTVNPNAVVARIRKIVKSIRCSPQKRQLFEGTVKVACPHLFEISRPTRVASDSSTQSGPAVGRPANGITIPAASGVPRATSARGRGRARVAPAGATRFVPFLFVK